MLIGTEDMEFIPVHTHTFPVLDIKPWACVSQINAP